MENEVILFGASGHCKVIIDILESNAISIATILDDNPNTTTILDKTVWHSSTHQFKKSDQVILSIGNNKVRKKLAKELDVTFSKAIHKKATVSTYAKIGNGTVIMAGAVINPEVIIGNHCIINSGAIIEHDCFIDNFAHISPNASLAGGVQVGEGTQIGIGASVIQGVKIGKWAIIGAGTVLINDVEDYAIVVGNPGKIIKYIEKS